MAQQTLQRIKAQAGKVKWNELYTLVLIAVGLPYVAYIWFGLKAAVTAFVLVNIVLGIVSARGR